MLACKVAGEDSQIWSRVVSMKILTFMLLSYMRWTFKQLTVFWEPIDCNCCEEATSVLKLSIQMDNNLANHFFEVDHFTGS